MYIKELKFSLWADFIERDYLDKEFKELIKDGLVNGATSNPAIFKNAILTSNAYKKQLQELDDLSAKQKYEALAIFDIQKASDVLKPLYEAGDDGYVSIEVDPFLCDDTQATIDEGKRLYKEIDRKNVMIKVPATPAGYEAMQELVSCGIAVNATLIFKKEQALSCAKAFQKGMEKFGGKVDCVISVFVSRVDRAIDDVLKQKDVQTALTGIYNSLDIYHSVEKMGITGCRVLFASTGVKDNSLPAHYYIQNLLVYNTVNTAPVDTINSFKKDGEENKPTLVYAKTIKEHFKKVAKAGIDLDEVLDKQIVDGLEAFKSAFSDILKEL